MESYLGVKAIAGYLFCLGKKRKCVQCDYEDAAVQDMATDKMQTSHFENFSASSAR